jgi:hypothetical protein
MIGNRVRLRQQVNKDSQVVKVRVTLSRATKWLYENAYNLKLALKRAIEQVKKGKPRPHGRPSQNVVRIKAIRGIVARHGVILKAKGVRLSYTVS